MLENVVNQKGIDMLQDGDTGYLVCRLLHWENIKVFVNGEVQKLSQPEDQKVIGFLPVYASYEDAESESYDREILALKVGAVIYEEKPDES